MEKNQKDVDLATLSSLTGFPVDFLKEELFIKEDSIPISNLREVALSLLDGLFLSK